MKRNAIIITVLVASIIGGSFIAINSSAAPEVHNNTPKTGGVLKLQENTSQPQPTPEITETVSPSTTPTVTTPEQAPTQTPQAVEPTEAPVEDPQQTRLCGDNFGPTPCPAQ